MLSTFATDDIIFWESKELESYEKAPELSAELYAKKLYTKALRCGVGYEEKGAKSLLIEGLGASAYDNMRSYLEQHPHTSLTELAHHKDKLIRSSTRAQGRAVRQSTIQ